MESIESRVSNISLVHCDWSGHYTYHALDSERREIRLLSIRPGKPEDPIQCKLRHAKLDEKPTYETISYAWGDATIRGMIRVNSVTISVPLSAERVLRVVRLPAELRTVWIDAVCINQQDPDERAQQVAFMRHIYAGSRGNLIQLGYSDTAKAAVDSMNNLLEEFRQRTRDFEDLTGIVPIRGQQLTASQVPLAMFDEKALLALFACPWFKYASRSAQRHW